MELERALDHNLGHDLERLFQRLLESLTGFGLSGDDDLTRNVRDMIATVQSLDPFADRFRYPSSKKGRPFEGIGADLEQLFQAHWLIVTYCEGATIEAREARNLDATILER